MQLARFRMLVGFPLANVIFTGYSLEEMDAVFGESATGGRAAEDQSRLLEIHRRLGLDKMAHGDQKVASADYGDAGEKHSSDHVDDVTTKE